jgi:hypothetical protein
MEKCHLIEVILSCIWHMFVPSAEQDKQDDDDDESILKAHPLACMYIQFVLLHLNSHNQIKLFFLFFSKR